MGLLDKVKEQAQTVTQTAKDAAQKGQGKLEEIQQKRTADALLRDLGLVAFRTEVGRITAEASAAESDRLISAIKAHELEHGQID
ncbi:MAG: hypothetical protein HKL81_05130 [Acidimicrobiaceae bacterium]|nr:hypothetical protein [Acidimicrobiaceae bacterium]